MNWNDRCIFFFSGACHYLQIGNEILLDSNNETSILEDLFFIPYDAIANDLPNSSISQEWLFSFSKQLSVKHFLFIIDSCISKRGFIQFQDDEVSKSLHTEEKNILNECLANNAVEVITAGLRGQETMQESTSNSSICFTSLKLCHNIQLPISIFTQVIIEGISGLSFGKSEWITAANVAVFIQRQVSTRTSDTQFPQYQKLLSTNGSFIFERKRSFSISLEESSPLLSPISSLYSPSSMEFSKRKKRRKDSSNTPSSLASSASLLEPKIKPIPVTIIFASLVTESNQTQITPKQFLENVVVDLLEEKQLLMDCFRDKNKSLSLRMEFAKNPNDLKRIFHLEEHGILILCNPNYDTQNKFTMQDDYGNVYSLPEKAIMSFISSLTFGIQLLLFISFTPELGKVFSNNITNVISMTSAISKLFLKPFFRDLFDGKSIFESFQSAKLSCELELNNGKYFSDEISTEIPDLYFFSQYNNDSPNDFTLNAFDFMPGDVVFLNSPPTSLSSPSLQLPHLSNVFIGRNQETLEFIHGIIGNRLISITGSPGIGKTAICLVVAHYLISCRMFPDGVHLIDLRNISSIASICFQIGNVLGLKITSEEALYSSDEFIQLECLFIFDNCDSIFENSDFKLFITSLLKRTKKLKIVLISRKEINAPSESTNSPSYSNYFLHAPPTLINAITNDNNNHLLSVPLERDLNIFQSNFCFHIKINELSEIQATSLFCKLVPKFVNFSHKIPILYGRSPMAIHLLAKIFGNLNKEEDILHFLKEQQEFLDDRESEDSNEDLRQIELSIESSFATLREELQKFSVSLAVFPSTFNSVLVSEVFGMSEKKVHSLIQDLVRHNLLYCDHLNRYSFHGLVKLYLLKKKTKVYRTEVATRRLHFILHYCGILSEANDSFVQGKESGLKLFDSERPNIEMAISIAQEEHEDIFLKLALVGDHIFRVRMSLERRIQIYEQCIELAKRNGDTISEASFLCSLGFSFERLGEYPRSESLYLEAKSKREQIFGLDHPSIAEVSIYSSCVVYIFL